MNKFDKIFYSIKKIISEGIDLSANYYYINFDLDLINEKYCDGGISYEELDKRSKDYDVELNIIQEDDTGVKSVSIKSSDKQKIIDFLSTFINSRKFDYITSFIVRSDAVSFDEDAMLDKSKLP